MTLYDIQHLTEVNRDKLRQPKIVKQLTLIELIVQISYE